jgi:hypothetical protein
MTENNQEQKLSDKILERIKSGQIKMKPKLYFVLKTILVAVGIFIIGSFILFLISFIGFHLRAGGVFYLPGFGLQGFGVYLKLLPWLLIFISVLLILLLEALAKRFSFVWRRPIFYSLLVVIMIALIGGIIVDRTSLHPRVLLQSRQTNLPIITPMYREFGMPRFENVHRGLVEELTRTGFFLRKADEELLNVIVSSDTRLFSRREPRENDSVVVMGERDNGNVKAFAIQVLPDDQFRTFERQVIRRPMR